MASFSDRSSVETCIEGILFNIGRARFLAADPRSVDTKMLSAHIVKAKEWLIKSKTFGFKDTDFIEKICKSLDSLEAPFNSQQLFNMYYECKNTMNVDIDSIRP
jgi:hypothetical protein